MVPFFVSDFVDLRLLSGLGKGLLILSFHGFIFFHFSFIHVYASFNFLFYFVCGHVLVLQCAYGGQRTTCCSQCPSSLSVLSTELAGQAWWQWCCAVVLDSVAIVKITWREWNVSLPYSSRSGKKSLLKGVRGRSLKPLFIPHPQSGAETEVPMLLACSQFAIFLSLYTGQM